MKTFEYTISDPIGIHTRPAGKLAGLAKSFNSNITITANGKSVSAKKMIAMMSLGVKQGQTLQVSCEGDDEDAATTALEEFLKNNL